MLRRILTYLIVVPLAVVLIALGVVNAHYVELVLDPFRPDAPAFALSLPFYVYLFASIVVGIVIGGWVTWRSQAHWRREARRKSADAQRWQAEADRLARERDRMLKDAVAATSASGSPARALALAGR